MAFFTQITLKKNEREPKARESLFYTNILFIYDNYDSYAKDKKSFGFFKFLSMPELGPAMP